MVVRNDIVKPLFEISAQALFGWCTQENYQARGSLASSFSLYLPENTP